MIAFGADQVRDSGTASRYIDKFIVVINLAGILETLGEIYISPKYGYFIFYIIATGMLILAIVLFLMGRRYSVHVKPYETVVVNCLPVYKNALQTWWAYRRRKKQQEVNIVDERPPTFLNFAKTVYNGKYQDWIVEDVKLLRNAFIVVLLVFPYRFIFYQVKQTSQFKYSTKVSNSFSALFKFFLSSCNYEKLYIGDK